MTKVIRENSAIIAICPKCEHRFNIYSNTFDETIRSPRDTFNAFFYLGVLDQEELHVALLNARNKIMKRVLVYKGNVSQTLVRVGEVFKEAVKENAASIILVHNHPSGDPTPSPDDLHLTAEVLAAGRLLDIEVLDHVIIGGTEFISLRDRGVAFDRMIPPIKEGV